MLGQREHLSHGGLGFASDDLGQDSHRGIDIFAAERFGGLFGVAGFDVIGLAKTQNYDVQTLSSIRF